MVFNSDLDKGWSSGEGLGLRDNAYGCPCLTVLCISTQFTPLSAALGLSRFRKAVLSYSGTESPGQSLTCDPNLTELVHWQSPTDS